MEYKPGWDCHGLPIELKALQSIASSDEVTDPVRIRQLSRKFASDAIKQQKKSIRQWGIMSDISDSLPLWHLSHTLRRQGQNGLLLHIYKGLRNQRASSFCRCSLISRSLQGNDAKGLHLPRTEACVLVAAVAHRSRGSGIGVFPFACSHPQIQRPSQRKHLHLLRLCIVS